MQYLAYLLPPSYVFEGMRAILLGGTVSESRLFCGAGLAVRTGLIARYSAESIS
jgi:ABC-2 type transport system permease protein